MSESNDAFAERQGAAVNRLCWICVSLVAFEARLSAVQVGPEENGRLLFNHFCLGCHGNNAKGGRAPDLTNGNWRHGATDVDLIKNIREGIAGTPMPPFPMPEGDAQAIVAYLRSASHRAVGEQSTGDPTLGQKLFWGEGQCSQCHMIRGRGGRLGPDLSHIGEDRTVSEVRQAITQPSQTIRPSFETVEVEFTNRTSLRGAAKNDDTFPVQLMDRQEKLHLLRKSDLKRVTPIRLRQSLMPIGSLKAAEVEDVIAFLVKSSGESEALGSALDWRPASRTLSRVEVVPRF